LHKVLKNDTFRKISLKMIAPKIEKFRLEDWINILQTKGRLAFSLESLRKEANTLSEDAIKLSLNRLSAKGKILSIHKGYYLIIPPIYQNKGVLPPINFIDDMMKNLNRPYYVGLLNAAALHGAGHQQPQTFCVVSNFPVLRPTIKKGIRINYLTIKDISSKYLQQFKTESGYVNVSSPELTATDLVQHEKLVGGLNRVATVLNELVDVIKPEKFDKDFLENIPIATIQRLGYLLEYELENGVIANKLFEEMKNMEKVFYRIPLKSNKSIKGYETNEKWKVVLNTEIEIDE
jgi:predicted transcriptional regulator of viral defense system